jgi:hypothetical protein
MIVLVQRGFHCSGCQLPVFYWKFVFDPRPTRVEFVAGGVAQDKFVFEYFDTPIIIVTPVLQTHSSIASAIETW